MELLHQYISLDDARFFAYHGFYPEEQLTGNEFIVNIETRMSLKVPVRNRQIGNEALSDTVNYEQLYLISKSVMAKPRKLLETVAYEILREVMEAFATCDEIRVSICKTSPPFGGDKAGATVKLSWKKESQS